MHGGFRCVGIFEVILSRLNVSLYQEASAGEPMPTTFISERVVYVWPAVKALHLARASTNTTNSLVEVKR